jgi:hypothetical protein
MVDNKQIEKEFTKKETTRHVNIRHCWVTSQHEITGLNRRLGEGSSAKLRNMFYVYMDYEINGWCSCVTVNVGRYEMRHCHYDGMLNGNDDDAEDAYS